MHVSVIKQVRVFFLMEKLLSVIKRQTNKDWERPVPAAAVIPAVQVAATIIGSKTSVACLVSFL
jgi:hypothetical protein